MAEIHVEKKSRGGWAWVWILLAILLIAVLAWLLWPGMETSADDDALPVATPADTADTMTLPPPPMLESTLATIQANPEQWIGKEFSGSVRVAEVTGDRGFWIEQDGERMFVVLVDDPAEQPVAIEQGQQLQIRGTVRDASYLPQLPGGPLGQADEQIVREQRAYLVAGENAIQITSGRP